MSRKVQMKGNPMQAQMEAQRKKAEEEAAKEALRAARAAKLAPWGELATTKKKDADTASVASEASAEETAAAKPKRLEGKIRVLVSTTAGGVKRGAIAAGRGRGRGAAAATSRMRFVSGDDIGPDNSAEPSPINVGKGDSGDDGEDDNEEEPAPPAPVAPAPAASSRANRVQVANAPVATRRPSLDPSKPLAPSVSTTAAAPLATPITVTVAAPEIKDAGMSLPPSRPAVPSNGTKFTPAPPIAAPPAPAPATKAIAVPSASAVKPMAPPPGPHAPPPRAIPVPPPRGPPPSTAAAISSSPVEVQSSTDASPALVGAEPQDMQKERRPSLSVPRAVVKTDALPTRDSMSSIHTSTTATTTSTIASVEGTRPQSAAVPSQSSSSAAACACGVCSSGQRSADQKYEDLRRLVKLMDKSVRGCNAVEARLSPDDFSRVFEVSKEDFLRLPKWQQTQLRKKTKLFTSPQK